MYRLPCSDQERPSAVDARHSQAIVRSCLLASRRVSASERSKGYTTKEGDCHAGLENPGAADRKEVKTSTTNVLFFQPIHCRIV
jgi:hypothetical protein